MCGIGFGLFQSPNNRTIVSSAPRIRTGAAGGMLATARLLGQTSGAVAVGVAFHLSGVGAEPEPARRRGNRGARTLRDLACCAFAHRARSIDPRPARRFSTNAFRS